MALAVAGAQRKITAVAGAHAVGLRTAAQPFIRYRSADARLCRMARIVALACEGQRSRRFGPRRLGSCRRQCGVVGERAEQRLEKTLSLRHRDSAKQAYRGDRTDAPPVC